MGTLVPILRFGACRAGSCAESRAPRFVQTGDDARQRNPGNGLMEYLSAPPLLHCIFCHLFKNSLCPTRDTYNRLYGVPVPTCNLAPPR